MSWFFWQGNNRKEIDARMDQFAEQLRQINESLFEVSNKVEETLQQQAECGVQLTKSTRLQYKTGQETKGKLDELAFGLTAVQQWQANYGDAEQRAALLSRQHQYMVDVLVAQLDDLDSVCAGMDSAGRDAWLPLFEGWAHRIAAALAEIGIHEVKVLGKVFDPQMAEGVGVMVRPPGVGVALQYEIVEVVKRGFINGEGMLLRKAQVITYQEGMDENG